MGDTVVDDIVGTLDGHRCPKCGGSRFQAVYSRSYTADIQVEVSSEDDGSGGLISVNCLTCDFGRSVQ